MSSKRTHLLLSTLFAALFFVGTAAPAHAQFGVTAGLNFESASDIETTTNTQENATLDNSTGYHAGIVYDLDLGPLNMRPGLLYRKVGHTYELPDTRADVAAWEVPVDLRLTLLSTPLVSPYILAGPKASFMQSDVQTFQDESLEDVSYSISFGIGTEVTLGSMLTLQPELRYDYGTTEYINEEFEFGGVTFEQEDPKLSAFALRLNVIF